MNKLGDLCTRFLDIVKDISQLFCANLGLQSSTHSNTSLAAVIIRLRQQHYRVRPPDEATEAS
jgi:hypothetical protein